LLPARPECPVWLTGDHDTLAVRVTAHPVCRALCQALQGPLVSTSANLNKKPPATHKLSVLKQFGQNIDYILPGELGKLSKPTEIRTHKGILVRAG
jgi:L-threonylcarbamoyladenylate synthase